MTLTDKGTVTNGNIEEIRAKARDLAVTKKQTARRNRDAENAILGRVRDGREVTPELREELLASDREAWTADADLYLHLRFYGYAEDI